jgi:hypothetical protein
MRIQLYGFVEVDDREGETRGASVGYSTIVINRSAARVDCCRQGVVRDRLIPTRHARVLVTSMAEVSRPSRPVVD